MTVCVMEDEARFAVDERCAVHETALASLVTPADECLRHALGADERHRHRWRLAAAVAVDGRVRGEQLDQPVCVGLLPGGEEAAGNLLALLA